MDKREKVVALYLDMTKAFDCVDHSILLNKLESQGIRGNANALIRSYLSNRKQITHIHRLCPKTLTLLTHESDFRSTKYGVPQGSVIGPLLFIDYINDLPNVTTNPMILFADDSTVMFIGDKCNADEVRTTLESTTCWLKNNNCQLNMTKTFAMNFKQRHKESDRLKLYYLDKTIVEVETTKFLGLIIDNRLNWKSQIDSVSKRLSTASYFLSKLRKLVDTETLIIAYHAHAGSILRYGIIFWGNSVQKKTAFVAQKRCIRAMLGLKRRQSCKKHFRQMKIMTTPSLYIYEITLFAKTYPYLFTFKDKGRNREGTMWLHGCKTHLLRTSVFCMLPIIFNKLPTALRIENDINVFKKILTSLLIEKAYYSIDDFLIDKEL